MCRCLYIINIYIEGEHEYIDIGVLYIYIYIPVVMLRPPVDSALYTLLRVCWHVWPNKNDTFVARLFTGTSKCI